MHLSLLALQKGSIATAQSRVTQFIAWVVGILFTLGFSTPGWSQAPTANMNFPQFNSSYIASTTIKVQNTITTPANTTITNVDLYYDTGFFSADIDSPTTGMLIVANLAAPYTYDWTPPTPTTPSRTYQIRAVVTNVNASGITTTSFSGGGTKYASFTVYRSDYSTAPRNLYVSPTGANNGNAGTGMSPTTPYQTIQYAADRAAPGDIINVMNGTYTTTGTTQNIVSIQRTGLPDKWITFRPYQSEKPVLQMGNNNWQAFNVLPAAAYIRVQGFEVIGNNASNTLAQARAQVGACEGSNPTGTPIARFNGNGISVNGRVVGLIAGDARPHHVVVASNNVHDCGGIGISAIESDYITIEDNITANTSWYTVYGTSGISILNAWNYDNSTDTKIIIRRNRSFGNRLFVAWNINGTGTNCRFYDGNGIILDNNNAAKNTIGAYTGKFLVENNLCYLNGGRGLNVNYTDNATLLNNTTYRNGVTDQTVFNSVTYAGIESEFISQFSSGINVYNNIFSGRPNEKTIEVNGSTIAHNNNLVYQDGGTGAPYFTGNQNITGQNPLFINAAGGDFQIPNSSPAINAGSNTGGQYAATDILGLSRPQGTVPDIGAYELDASALPVTLSQFTAKPLGERVSVAWSTASEQNSAYFEVERSGSLAEFSRVGRIDAAGESKTTRSYGLLDEKPLAGSNYYRLKQVDRDGSVAYSKIVSVVMDNLAPSLEVLGNPTETSTIRVITRNLDGATYLLTTATGQPISLAMKPESNGELVLMPAQPLPTGIYLIQARNGALHLIRKVLVR